ncbi:prolyl 3-hydroxylase OGFOD1 [Ixodes scapularis]|uniref:prolyl 3-hydroxylase OGFOD1 n=1 Tax=Ixodes scapularis TaxID=6945 RepID=UPI001C37F815|nr:prolyl 3-hydroxylase OGFOD1 [Ixodes scapularis]
MSSSKRMNSDKPKNQTATVEPKRKKNSVVLEANRSLFLEPTKNDIREAFRDQKPCEIENVAELTSKPFNFCLLHHFLVGNDNVESLKNELFDIDFHQKNNDLYKFQQSDDLQQFDTPYIEAFRNCLTEKMVPWLQDVTDIPLDGKISLTCSKYAHTDVLLCHDDELEGRRIAFILYLTFNWKESDGGALDLFDVDTHNCPRDIVRSVVPRYNSLAFFEVSPVSFHQVAEVLSEDKLRLSIGGWFHGPPIQRPPPYVGPVENRLGYCSVELDVFRSWINPIYLADEIIQKIRKTFRSNSEIFLEDFLQEEKFKALEEALRDPSIIWHRMGPWNHRNTLQDPLPLPPVVEECLSVFRSDAMFLILSNLTGLRLHRLAQRSDDSSSEEEEEEEEEGDEPRARCTQKVYKWGHGNYILAHDDDPSSQECSLDLKLYLNVGDWKMEYGGFTTYIVKDEDEEILTIEPSSNSLALVYRDNGLLKFVKHINHQAVKRLPAGNACFYEVSFAYYE